MVSVTSVEVERLARLAFQEMAGRSMGLNPREVTTAWNKQPVEVQGHWRAVVKTILNHVEQEES